MTYQYVPRDGLAHIHCCHYPVPIEVADKRKREVHEVPSVTVNITMQADSVEQILAELKRRGFKTGQDTRGN